MVRCKCPGQSPENSMSSLVHKSRMGREVDEYGQRLALRAYRTRVTVSSLSVTVPPRRLRFQPSIEMARRADRTPATSCCSASRITCTSRSSTNS